MDGLKVVSNSGSEKFRQICNSFPAKFSLDVNAGGYANYKEIIPVLYGNYIFESEKFEAEAGLRWNTLIFTMTWILIIIPMRVMVMIIRNLSQIFDLHTSLIRIIRCHFFILAGWTGLMKSTSGSFQSMMTSKLLRLAIRHYGRSLQIPLSLGTK